MLVTAQGRVQPAGNIDRIAGIGPGVTQRGDEAGEPSGAGAGDVLPVDGDLPGQGGAERLGAGELAQVALACAPRGVRVDQHPPAA